VTVGVVSQPAADAERYRCACLHCTQGLAGRGDGYQCSLDWGRSSNTNNPTYRAPECRKTSVDSSSPMTLNYALGFFSTTPRDWLGGTSPK